MAGDGACLCVSWVKIGMTMLTCMFPSTISCNLISLGCEVSWMVIRLPGLCCLAQCAVRRCFKTLVLRTSPHSACGAAVNLDLGIIVHGSVQIGRVICRLPWILLLGGLGGFIEMKTRTMPCGVPRWRGRSGSVVSTLLVLANPVLLTYVLQFTQVFCSGALLMCWLFGSRLLALLTFSSCASSNHNDDNHRLPQGFSEIDQTPLSTSGILHVVSLRYTLSGNFEKLWYRPWSVYWWWIPQFTY